MKKLILKKRSPTPTSQSLIPNTSKLADNIRDGNPKKKPFFWELPKVHLPPLCKPIWATFSLLKKCKINLDSLTPKIGQCLKERVFLYLGFLLLLLWIFWVWAWQQGVSPLWYHYNDYFTTICRFKNSFKSSLRTKTFRVTSLLLLGSSLKRPMFQLLPSRCVPLIINRALIGRFLSSLAYTLDRRGGEWTCQIWFFEDNLQSPLSSCHGWFSNGPKFVPTKATKSN